MTKQKAILEFCRDCVGGDFKERALCTAQGKCTLWPFRMGWNANTSKYRAAMRSVLKRWPKECAEMDQYGVDLEKYFGKVKS
jgi:hypothetical protein